MANELTFYERLTLAQTELKAPKNQVNSFGKYKYRSAEDILEGVKPVNKKYQLHLSLSDEIIEIGGKNYIKATAIVVDQVDQKNKHSVTAFAREAVEKKGMDDSQITGAASSYARKYALNGLYLIDDTKDADTDEHQNQARNNTNSNRNKQSPNSNNEFEQNKQEVISRLNVVSSKMNQPYEALEKWVIQESNKKLNMNFDMINPNNISMVVGFVKVLENKANKTQPQTNQQGSMFEGNTTNPVKWGE